MTTTTLTVPEARGFCSGAGITVKQGANGIAAALKEVGLDWTVEKHAIQTPAGVDFPEKRMTVTSTGKPLGIVGNNYGVVDNAQAFGIVDSILETDKYKLDGFVTVKGGRSVRCELRFIEPVKLLAVGDELANARVSIITSHDGSTQTVATTWLERLKCTNGMRSLHPTKVFAIRHTGNAADRISQVTDVREQLGMLFSAASDVATALAAKKMTDKAMRAALVKAYKVKSDAVVIDATMTHLQLTSTVDDELRGTAWGLYNALTERNEWASAARSREAAFVSSWNGRGAHIAQRLVATLSN